jgi:hypothetical protein
VGWLAVTHGEPARRDAWSKLQTPADGRFGLACGPDRRLLRHHVRLNRSFLRFSGVLRYLTHPDMGKQFLGSPIGKIGNSEYHAALSFDLRSSSYLPKKRHHHGFGPAEPG